MSELRQHQMISNAHLLHAVMPTLLALIDNLPLGEGVKVDGIEIDGRDASINIDNKIAAGLLRHFLGMIDEACLRAIREAPLMPTLRQSQ